MGEISLWMLASTFGIGLLAEHGSARERPGHDLHHGYFRARDRWPRSVQNGAEYRMAPPSAIVVFVNIRKIDWHYVSERWFLSWNSARLSRRSRSFSFDNADLIPAVIDRSQRILYKRFLHFYIFHR
jgi:hypothetical protein